MNPLPPPACDCTGMGVSKSPHTPPYQHASQVITSKMWRPYKCDRCGVIAPYWKHMRLPKPSKPPVQISKVNTNAKLILRGLDPEFDKDDLFYSKEANQ